MAGKAGKRGDLRVALMMADGLEEIEALTVKDLLFRAGVGCDLVSIAPTCEVCSSHGVRIGCDMLIDDVDFDGYDALVLPGGMPGTTNLGACEPLTRQVRDFAEKGKWVCAICAAPSILAEMGLLAGRVATCFPGREPILVEHGARLVRDSVAVDGNIITSRGMGTAIDFGLEIVRALCGDDAASELAASIVYSGWKG